MKLHALFKLLPVDKCMGQIHFLTEWEILHFSKYFQLPQLSWVFMSLQHEKLAE